MYVRFQQRWEAVTKPPLCGDSSEAEHIDNKGFHRWAVLLLSTALRAIHRTYPVCCSRSLAVEKLAALKRRESAFLSADSESFSDRRLQEKYWEAYLILQYEIKLGWQSGFLCGPVNKVEAYKLGCEDGEKVVSFCIAAVTGM